MKTYANRTVRATRTITATPIVCSGCGHAGAWGCYCHIRIEVSARKLLRAFLAAGDNLDKRRLALAAIREWARLDAIESLETREERNLIARSKADRTRRLRGLTGDRIGGALALHLHRQMFEPQFSRGGPESIEVLARRHRVPVAMVAAQRDRFIRRTAFAATAAPAPVGADTRRLVNLGTSLLAVCR